MLESSCAACHLQAEDLITERLVQFAACPATDLAHGQDGRPSLERIGQDRLRCPQCGRVYAVSATSYLDLMPPAEGVHTSQYVSHEDEFAHKLDYRHIGMPLLGA